MTNTLPLADAIELHDKHTPHARNETGFKNTGENPSQIFLQAQFEMKVWSGNTLLKKKITFLGVFGKILSVHTLATENCLKQSFFTIKRKPAFRQNHDYCETIQILSQLLKRLLYVNIRLN